MEVKLGLVHLLLLSSLLLLRLIHRWPVSKLVVIRWRYCGDTGLEVSSEDSVSKISPASLCGSGK